VILKQYAADRGRRPDRTHASRELAMLRRLDAPGVVRALGLELENDGAVLVLERAPGISLGELARTSGVLDVETCIRIGLGIARALEAVHGPRIVYGNLDPATVLVDRDTLDVCLVDFDGASDVGAPRLSPTMLQYVAPEQTGRVAAGVDRYQSAHGVRIDLDRCYQCLASEGTLTADFELGADGPSAPTASRSGATASAGRSARSALRSWGSSRTWR
jgi:serine/threonine protein kinase